MKACKVLRIILAIVCALLTVELGIITILLGLHYLAGVDVIGSILTTTQGITEIAEMIGNLLPIPYLDWILVGVVFLLPTILLLVATNVLFASKKVGAQKAGYILGIIALAIFVTFTCVFREKIVGEHWQDYCLYILLGVSVLYLLVTIPYASLLKKQSRLAKEQTMQPMEQGDLQVEEPSEQIDGEQAQDEQIDQPAEEVTEQPIEQEEIPQAPEQEADGEVLFMADDYSSVSQVADQTYSTAKVLSAKVLEKLRIARELYEKGAINKDEYLSIVNKYLEN